MITVVLAIVGAILGAGMADEEGMVFGLFIGLALGLVSTLKARVFKLERELAKISKFLHNQSVQSKQANAQSEPVPQPEPKQTITPQPTVSPQAAPAVKKEALAAREVKQDKTTLEPINLDFGADSVQQQAKPQPQPKKPARPIEPDFAEKIFFKVRDFFTTGNVVVKVGAIVLFFGVAFLLKYAAERMVFPIELRLASVIAVGIVMLVIGWRLRDKKREYALILQGAALGILYLTLFSIAKIYQLLPMSLTLLIMLGLVVLTGVLAVKQDAKSLAIFGSVGGFLAPILMSTGSGSHIMLFSYYTLLNLGIFGIAWFKSWRILNLVGFVFTFVISGLWGYKAYQPEFFISTEAFLILFYLLFLSISILFAFKQPPKLKGYVDGSLIFGLPLIAFALQSELVRGFEYGQSYTAAAMGALYLLLSRLLWRLNNGRFKLLAESFLALGITFGSLAIPLYLDGRWTAAVWALEGAALVWIGLKQAHFIPRAFGLILTVGAGFSFLESLHGHLADSLPVINSTYLGMVLLSVAALFIGYLYEKAKTSAYDFEYKISKWFIIAGLAFWFMAGLIEIDHFASSNYEWKLSLIFLAISTFIQAVISYKLKWEDISLSAILLMPAIVFITLGTLVDDVFSNEAINPLNYLGFIAWPLALFVHILVLSRHDKKWPKSLLSVWHAAGVWVTAFIALWVVVDVVDGLMPSNVTWLASSSGLILALTALVLLYIGKKVTWPIGRYPNTYYIVGLAPVMLILVLWQFASNTEAGTPVFFNYLPVINPLDITQAIVLGVLVYWLSFISKLEGSPIKIPAKVLAVIAGAMSFMWINIVIARTVHAFASVTYTQKAIMGSGIFQMSTSIVWSVLAIILMVAALKKSSRMFWFAGAGLLALVVLKLFFIDLAESGSISRIVSFLVVGGLMLLVGYFSPLPPKKEQGSSG